MAVGRRAAMETLRAGRPLVRLVVSREAQGLAGLVALARENGVPVEAVPGAVLDRMTGGVRHQGVAAVLAAAAYAPEDSVVERVLAAGSAGLAVVLDQVTDPGNLGAILRSAEAFGAQGVIVPSRRAAGLSAGVMRASAGAAVHLPVERVVNVARTLSRLREAGVHTLAAEAQGGTPLPEADLEGPLALVLGSEARGLRPLVRAQCERVVTVPTVGHLGSLNVSVAAGILLYEVARRRWDRP